MDGMRPEGRGRRHDARVLLACNLVLIAVGFVIAGWAFELLSDLPGIEQSSTVPPDQLTDTGQPISGATSAPVRIAQLRATGIAAAFAGVAIVVGGLSGVRLAMRKGPSPH